MFLYHYFEKGGQAFLTLSDLPDEQAKIVQNKLKKDNNVYERRDFDGRYMHCRRIVESNVRCAFIEKGGKPVRQNPVYCMLGISHLKNNSCYDEWYRSAGYIEIPITQIDADSVSFTYGDSFVVNHPDHHDQSKYRERVFTYKEILEIIKQRGWPQDYVKADSPFWIPRYIEAQIWSDEIINRYKV